MRNCMIYFSVVKNRPTSLPVPNIYFLDGEFVFIANIFELFNMYIDCSVRNKIKYCFIIIIRNLVIRTFKQEKTPVELFTKTKS